MHDLTPLTALGASTPVRQQVSGLLLEEIADLALASVAARSGQETACISALAAVLGAEVPGVGKAQFSVPLAAFWTGPDQWMVIAPHASHEELADALKTALGGKASITEQTDGWVCFDLEGEAVVDLMERLCAAPTRRFVTGDVQRTTIDHLGCFVLCLQTQRKMRVLGPRSAAGSLYHALHTAALSIA